MFAETDGMDVMIVGGGLAGLSAATYLARAGVSVTLFEKAAEVGGRAATQVYDGYAFNRGAHALYPGGAATQVLQELGIPYHAGNPTGVQGLRGGRFDLLPATPDTLLRSRLVTAGDKLELGRALLALGMKNAKTVQRTSIQAWINGHTRRPRVRQLMASIARTIAYSAALDQVSAEVFATQIQLLVERPGALPRRRLANAGRWAAPGGDSGGRADRERPRASKRSPGGGAGHRCPAGRWPPGAGQGGPARHVPGGCGPAGRRRHPSCTDCRSSPRSSRCRSPASMWRCAACPRRSTRWCSTWMRPRFLTAQSLFARITLAGRGPDPYS